MGLVAFSATLLWRALSHAEHLERSGDQYTGVAYNGGRRGCILFTSGLLAALGNVVNLCGNC